MTTVYVVRRNADLTEGRGPMVFDSVWADEKAAQDYADNAPRYHKDDGLWTVSPEELR